MFALRGLGDILASLSRGSQSTDLSSYFLTSTSSSSPAGGGALHIIRAGTEPPEWIE